MFGTSDDELAADPEVWDDRPDTELDESELEEDDEIVRWGIIGPGWIARGALMPAFLATPGCEVVAVASRDGVRAATFAADFDIPRSYDRYENLIDDPEVEAVYIALPNHLHAEWAIRAAQAGKHILCEKPLAHTLASAESMIRVAEEQDVLFMEAVMYRYHPRSRRIAELIADGAIGAPKLLTASFCFTMAQIDNYRSLPEMGGGALLDVGSYGVNAARWLLGEEPIAALALGTVLESGADETVTGMLTFPSGALANIQCSFGMAEYQQLTIVGTEGRIEVETPFTTWKMAESSIWLYRADSEEEILFPPADHYALMIAHFNDCVRDQDDPWWPSEDGLNTMRALDALRRSTVSGRTERVAG